MLRYRKDLVMCQMAIPALSGQVVRTAHLQSLVDQAIVVCALERYRKAKGNYPTSLIDLSPVFIDKIPWDIVNGLPLHYRKEGGSFLLYSIGWNLKDDGGRTAWTSTNQHYVDPEEGDWTWPRMGLHELIEKQHHAPSSGREGM